MKETSKHLTSHYYKVRDTRALFDMVSALFNSPQQLNCSTTQELEAAASNNAYMAKLLGSLEDFSFAELVRFLEGSLLTPPIFRQKVAWWVNSQAKLRLIGYDKTPVLIIVTFVLSCLFALWVYADWQMIPKMENMTLSLYFGLPGSIVGLSLVVTYMSFLRDRETIRWCRANSKRFLPEVEGKYTDIITVTSVVQTSSGVQVTAIIESGRKPTTYDQVCVLRTGKLSLVKAAVDMNDVRASLSSAVVMGSGQNLGKAFGITLDNISSLDIQIGDKIGIF